MLDTDSGGRMPLFHASRSKYPFWAPRFWHGMRFSDWFRLVRHNHFRIHPFRWGLATTVTGLSLFNSTMSVLNRWKYQRQVAATEVLEAPVFIVGHWRSGTTYLHELMSCDRRFATAPRPTNVSRQTIFC